MRLSDVKSSTTVGQWTDRLPGPGPAAERLEPVRRSPGDRGASMRSNWSRLAPTRWQSAARSPAGPCYLCSPADCHRRLACLTAIRPAHVYRACRPCRASDLAWAQPNWASAARHPAGIVHRGNVRRVRVRSTANRGRKFFGQRGCRGCLPTKRRLNGILRDQRGSATCDDNLLYWLLEQGGNLGHHARKYHYFLRVRLRR